jgi:hypothetical protein
MLCVPGQRSQAELAFITEMKGLDLQSALQQLLTTNMVVITSIPSGSSFTSQYGLADLPREYLSKYHPPTSDERSIFTKRRRQLAAAEEEAKSSQRTKSYLPKNIFMRSSSDFIC